MRFTMQYVCQCKWGLQPAKTLVPQRLAPVGVGIKLAWRGVVFYETPGESFGGGEGPPEFFNMYTCDEFFNMYTSQNFSICIRATNF